MAGSPITPASRSCATAFSRRDDHAGVHVDGLSRDRARFVTETMPRFRDELLPLFENRALRAVVDRALPLEEVYEAHRLVDARTHFGKIILSVP